MEDPYRQIRAEHKQLSMENDALRAQLAAQAKEIEELKKCRHMDPCNASLLADQVEAQAKELEEVKGLALELRKALQTISNIVTDPDAPDTHEVMQAEYNVIANYAYFALKKTKALGCPFCGVFGDKGPGGHTARCRMNNE